MNTPGLLSNGCSLLSAGIVMITAASGAVDCLRVNKQVPKKGYPQALLPLYITLIVFGIFQILMACFKFYSVTKGGM